LKRRLEKLRSDMRPLLFNHDITGRKRLAQRFQKSPLGLLLS